MKIHLRQGYGGQRMRKGEGEKENIELIISSCHIIITKN